MKATASRIKRVYNKTYKRSYIEYILDTVDDDEEDKLDTHERKMLKAHREWREKNPLLAARLDGLVGKTVGLVEPRKTVGGLNVYPAGMLFDVVLHSRGLLIAIPRKTKGLKFEKNVLHRYDTMIQLNMEWVRVEDGRRTEVDQRRTSRARRHVPQRVAV